jgi:hypothetical protein
MTSDWRLPGNLRFERWMLSTMNNCFAKTNPQTWLCESGYFGQTNPTVSPCEVGQFGKTNPTSFQQKDVPAVFPLYFQRQ